MRNHAVTRLKVEDNELDYVNLVRMADWQVLEVPVYKLGVVPNLNCARYARLVSFDLFGKEFNAGDAWNLRYHNETLPVVDFEKQYWKGEINPGDLAGIRRRASNYKDYLDEIGSAVPYTHAAVFLGEDIMNNMRFAEQIGTRSEPVTLNQIIFRGDVIVEVIKPRNVTTAPVNKAKV